MTKYIQWLLKSIMDQLVIWIISGLPHAPVANQVKRWLMNLRGAQVEKGVKIWSGVWVDEFKLLRIGKSVSLGHCVIIVATGGIYIGDYCMIGHGSALISAGHRVPEQRGQMRYSGPELDQIHLENDVWVGAKAVILPGVTIGEGAVVGAGAVVTNDVPPFAVVGGVPARILKYR